MDIVCCPDDNYIIPCSALIVSVCENNMGSDINFYIVSSGLSEVSKSMLRRLAEKYGFSIFFYQVNADLLKCLPLKGKGQPSHITIAAYYRLLLSSVLPLFVTKVLYLDCDIIVRHSLKELFDENISEVALAVVQDDYQEHCLRLGYETRYGYFNSGVLLLNLTYWRENNLENELLEYAYNNIGLLQYHDQDILNAVLKDRKKQMSIAYNVQSTFLKREIMEDENYATICEQSKDPVIVHYTGLKPWHKECWNPYKKDFFKYLKLTGLSVRKRRSLPLNLYLKYLIRGGLEKLGVLPPVCRS